MAEIKGNYTGQQGQTAPKKAAKIKDKTFKQKVRDAFISDEVHDVKTYVIFDVIIPAIKETLRNLVVNTIDMSLFGKTRSSRESERRGGSTYIAYERAYGNPRDDRSSRPRRESSSAPLRITELDRVVFKNRDDAMEVLGHLFDNVEEYHVASVADFLGAAGLTISPIHHKWGWYDLAGSSVEEDPETGDFWIRVPKPVSI